MVQLLLVDNHELCYRLFNCGKNLFKHGIEICHKLIGLCIPPFHKEAKIYFSDAKFKIPKCKGIISLIIYKFPCNWLNCMFID